MDIRNFFEMKECARKKGRSEPKQCGAEADLARRLDNAKKKTLYSGELVTSLWNETAGIGKTETQTQLMITRSDKNILFISYTNAAVDELKNRTSRILAKTNARCISRISTMDSIAAELCAPFSSEISTQGSYNAVSKSFEDVFQARLTFLLLNVRVWIEREADWNC